MGLFSTSASRPSRTLLVGAAAAVVVAALVVLALVLGGFFEGGTATSAAAPTSGGAASPSENEAGPSGPTAETPTGPTVAVDELPPALPPVPLDESVVVRGVTASVASVEEIDGQAEGPGNVGGPALRVTVRIQNGTDAELALGGVSVTMAYGPEQTPASPLEDRSYAPFVGTLGPGGVGEGVYVFRVPLDGRDAVTVEVRSSADAARILFTGPVG